MKHKLTKVILLSLLSGLLLAGVTARAGDSVPSEYEVKAAFLYNFTKFVKWPEAAFSQTNSPLTIGILGDDPFGSSLEAAIKDKAINGHPLAVRRLSSLPEMKSCQVVFICQTPRRNLPDTLRVLDGAGVLTVSETDHFIESGGMINFVMENTKVRFEINDSAAVKAGLTISSKLLNVARKRERKE